MMDAEIYGITFNAKIAILSTAPPANIFNRVNKPPPPELNAA